MALSPFYPQLFDRLYGIEEPAATGLFLSICRASALLALPALALLARRIALPRLVAGGLAACAVFDAALALAPSFAAFTALSAAGAAAGSALLLAYPVLVALDEDADGPGRGVPLFVALLYGSTIVATVVGAGVLSLGDPRWGLASFALADLAVLALVIATLPPSARRQEAPRSLWSLAPLRGVAAVIVVAVCFELAANVIRPFFTAYAQDGGRTLGEAALLFLLPAAAALAGVAVARPAQIRFGTALLPGAFALAAVGLALQAASTDWLPLVLGRTLLGVGLGVAHVALDDAMFTAAGTAGPGYATVETARAAAILAAPALAAVTASDALELPLVLGAVLFAAAAAMAPALVPRSLPEEPRVTSC
jgi:predicted MFS family arabinose efflux permease